MGGPVTSAFRVTAFSCLLIAGAAHADCFKGNSGIPPGANTTDPKAPFYIDTTDLDFKTLPPTRDPKNPNYPQATELPDGTLPASGAEGNFIIGPTHKPAPELTAQDGVPAGKVYSFTMSSNDSTVYNPGMIRDDKTAASTRRSSPARRRPATSRTCSFRPPTPASGRDPSTSMFRRAMRPEPRSRSSSLATAGRTASSMKRCSSPSSTISSTSIARRRWPQSASARAARTRKGASAGSNTTRSTALMRNSSKTKCCRSPKRHANVKLTKNPDGRATMGISSSGVAAFTMAWFHPEFYHRVLAYSPTVVNQEWPHNPALPGGAWEYHSPWAGAPVPDLNVEGVNVSKTDTHFAVAAHSQQPRQADPHLVRGRRPGFVLSRDPGRGRHA